MKLTLVLSTQRGETLFVQANPPKNNLSQQELEDYADGRTDYRKHGHKFIGALRGHVEAYKTETEFSL